jgi:hypothetical protein
MKFSLTDLIKGGLPKPGTPTKPLDAATMAKAEAQLRAEWAARKAKAAVKREKAYAARAARCEAILDHVASQMTAAERGRWSSMLSLIRAQALKRKTTSADLKIDLQDVLPNEILTRCGLPVDADAAPVAKDWSRRGYPAGLVKDTQPATDGKMVVTAQMIIEAAAKARGGDVPPEKQIDPRQPWHRK